MMKIVFILGVIFCFLQIVCSFPAALEQKSENDSSEEVGDPEDMLANFIFGTLMTCEVLASTFLTHCNNIFPPTDLAMDKRNHAISKSLIEVWTDLRTMEAAQSVYVQLTFKYASNNTNDNINSYFEALDKALSENPVTGQRYKEAKSKNEKIITLEADHLEKETNMSTEAHEKMVEKYLPQKKFYSLNLVFSSRLNSSDETDVKKLKFFVMAKSLVELSKRFDQAKYEKLQKIYNDCLTEVAAKFDSDDIKSSDAAKSLFRILNKKINEEPSLKNEFEEQKKELKKKLREQKNAVKRVAF